MELHKRRKEILARLQEEGDVAVDRLATLFDVSENTIRNDLNAMEEENLLKRVRGGATVQDSNTTTRIQAFDARFGIQKEAKQQIGAWAADLIEDGDVIILDASSTVYHMVTFLKHHSNLTVVTNGLEVAWLLARNPSNTVLLSANKVSPHGFSVVGELNAGIRNNFRAYKCFVSCSGFSIEQGLTEVEVAEGPLKSEMMGLAQKVIALVDHSKLGKVDAYRFASLDDIDHFVTDDGLAPHDVDKITAAAQFPLTLAGPHEARTFEPEEVKAQA